MKYLQFCMLTVVTALITGCGNGVESPRGFSLPEGDVTNGKAVFIKYQCLSCHQLEGIEPAGVIDNPKLSVKLGGKRSEVKTYAELVTSVINPSHKIAKGYLKSLVQVDGISKMTNYNDVMTVTELVDLIVFLQPHYQVYPNFKSRYPYYQNP